MYKDLNRLYDVNIERGNVRKYKSLALDCVVGDTVQATIQNLIDFGSTIKIDLICDICNKEFQRQARQIKERQAGEKFCIRCANQILLCKDKTHIGKSNQEVKDLRDLEKYGKTGLTQDEKFKQTCLERFGAENPYASEIIKEKIKKTNLEKYGVENALEAEEIKEKIKNTNLERYGAENPFASEEIKEKSKKTKLEKYGDENYANLEKARQTNLERYGVEHNFQREDVKQAIYEANQVYVSSQEFYDFRLKLRKEKGWGEFRSATSDWEKYKFLVWESTNRNDLTLLENYEKRGLAGVDGGYQLDHKVSIKFGFDNNIEPDIIGNINNIEFIPWEENLSKGSGCSITLEELIKKGIYYNVYY